MRFYSPLRYPGGKNKLAKFITLACEKNNVNGNYIEPYAGGAAVALHLLIEGCVSKVTINDIDRSIYAFWYSVLNHTDKLCKRIESVDVNIKTWHKQKKIQDNKNKANLFDLGFSTFFLNRTNRSGILTAGVIGGKDQSGNYKIDCRFNKSNLIRRIETIREYKSGISIYNDDMVDLVKRLRSKINKEDSIFYFDPPYYVKGSSLYVNSYDHSDHKKVSDFIQEMDDVKWIISYDNVSEIKSMYSGLRSKEYKFFHTANKTKKGKEILFFSNDLKIPDISNPTKV